MAASVPVTRHPVRVFEAVVAEVRDLGPHFRRITFAGPSLQNFGVPGPTLDLRIKMLLPVPGHALQLPCAVDGTLEQGWYQAWLRQEQPGRGFVRSYTVRTLRRSPAGAELDVDFVLHAAPGGHAGPGTAWAQNAVPGQRAWFVGPDVTAVTTATPLPEAGINWKPGAARHVLLAGDETAVPAISSILGALPEHLSGEAFLEVPAAGDILPLASDSRVRVTWLNRDGGVPRGQRLERAVADAVSNGDAGSGTYAWVGAEAETVRDLRRCLVGAGVDARMSEFRGYWSLGKAGSGANGVPLTDP
ncbi:siderophore-interacting protein [Pseudarthrobacter sp. NamB4]|uniref:siderophore-interacting protein n=1 Tax=Pseudarthrobacter sp. NamB4 TaxID=2576837 RepID=UPI001F10447E|nr:siderophore-interacting protein [Pseudarthrobacter sp. NamB4]